nr:hypothetical protein GCM10020063_044410 [Dactylosporangium thailandense]
MHHVTQARQPLVTFVADPDADWHRFIIDVRAAPGTAAHHTPAENALIGRAEKALRAVRGRHSMSRPCSAAAQCSRPDVQLAQGSVLRLPQLGTWLQRPRTAVLASAACLTAWRRWQVLREPRG